MFSIVQRIKKNTHSRRFASKWFKWMYYSL